MQETSNIILYKGKSMERFKKFIKEMRFEYKVLSAVMIILLLSVPYTIIKKKFFPNSNVLQLSNNSLPQTAGVGGAALSDMQNSNNSNSNSAEGSKPSSISEAVNTDRPLIIDETAVNSTANSNFMQIMSEIPEIKHIELATQVEYPTVWIYSLNDGLRKDEEAAKYCHVLHNKGILASNVTIYDERERRNGRLIELGTAKCM